MNPRRPAFGILETLLAAGVLITVVSATVGLGTAAIRAGQLGADRQIAYHLANEALEIVRQTRDGRWADNDPTTTWKTDAVGLSSVTGFCTLFPDPTDQDFACSNHTGDTGKTELFFDALTKKWKALYCSNDLDPQHAQCGSFLLGGTLGEDATSKKNVSMLQDGASQDEKIYLLKNGKLAAGTILDNNHGPNSVVTVGNAAYDAQIAAQVVRTFDRQVRLRQASNGAQGLLPLSSPIPSDCTTTGQCAVQVVATVSWYDTGKQYSVESSTILTNWKWFSP